MIFKISFRFEDDGDDDDSPNGKTVRTNWLLEEGWPTGYLPR